MNYNTLLVLIITFLSSSVVGAEDDGDDFFKSSEEIDPTIATTTVDTDAESKTEDTPAVEIAEVITGSTTESSFGFFGLFGENQEDPNAPKEYDSETEERVNKLSDQIRAVIKKFREEGIVTLPSSPLPDPMRVADFKKVIAGSPINFKDMSLHGLSNFTVDHINTDLEKMQVFVALHMKRLIIYGNYSIRGWLSKSNGPFNVTLLDVEANGAAELERDEEGNLMASESEMDMSFMDAKVHFENAGVMGAIIQGLAGSVAPTLFEAIKPTIMREVNTKLRSQVNQKMKAFANQIAVGSDNASPVDKAIAAGRIMVRENGYDPYVVRNEVIKRAPVIVNISECTLYGLSKFYRVGEVGLSMDSGNVQMSIHLATKKLNGYCLWAVDIGKAFSRTGESKFTIKHLQVRALVNQSLDVKNPPKLEKIDLNVGPIKLEMDKSQSFNSLIEFVVNSMPAIIRHVLVDALEIPLKYQVQRILDRVDMEMALNKTLPELDNMGL